MSPTEAPSIHHKRCRGAAWHQSGQEQLEAALPAASRTSAPGSREGAGLCEELVYQPEVRRPFWSCVRVRRERVVSQQCAGQA